MSEKKTCQCFTCRNKGRPDLLLAYYQGCLDTVKPLLGNMQRLNIGKAPIHEESLESLHSIIEDEVNYYGYAISELTNKPQDNSKLFANKKKIDLNRQFLAFYKSFSEYQVFYLRKNFETKNLEVVSAGEGNIYPEAILDNFKHIIYLDVIFDLLYKQVKQ